MLVTLYKTDEKNRVHYYSIDDRQGNLFTRFHVCVTWGTNPQGGRVKHHELKNQEEKDALIRSLIRKKLKLGYKVLYTYFRDGVGETSESSQNPSQLYGLA